MPNADLKAPRRTRLGTAVVVGALHLLAVAALLRAFAPNMASTVVTAGVAAFDVPVARPEPPPPQLPPQPPVKERSVRAKSAAAPVGAKASPREVVAPPVKIVLSPSAAPLVAGIGNADSAGTGAAASGAGAGTGGMGQGAGSGGGVIKAVKIAGDIGSARDYPKQTRDLRLGSAVTILLTVTAEGRVGGCRIVRPSRDPEADRITCRLATDRFRFRPARDAAGRPVETTYGWQQRWFTPERK